MYKYYLLIPLLITLNSQLISQKEFRSCESSTLIIETPEGPNPWSALDLNNDNCQFQFAIVTDRTGGHRPGVFEDGVRKLNLLQPEFVMSVGDLIEGYTEDTATLNREWDEFTGFIDHLEMPFFYLPGNHDITNQVMEDMWRERFGRTYYHFIYKNVLFLCLNSEDQRRGAGRGSISDEQFEYAKKVLEDNQNVRWTLVFMHQPLWVQETDPIRWFDLENLLADREHHVIVGHHHNYVKYERNRGKYFILATTGGGSGLRGPQLGEFDHVVWVTMTDEGPVMANLLLEGIWDENVMTDTRKEYVEKLLGGDMIRIQPLYTEGESFENGEYRFKVTNHENIPLEVEIHDGFSWDIAGHVELNQLVVPPNSVEEINIHLENKNNLPVSWLRPLPLNFTFGYDSEEIGSVKIPVTYEIKPVIKYYVNQITSPVTIDGLLNEWNKFPVSHKEPEVSDNEVRISLAQDDTYIYLASYVQDDTIIVDTSTTVWRQDSFNWIINVEDPKTIAHSRSYHPLRIAPAFGDFPAKMRNVDHLPPGVLWASQADENGYGTEIAIPLHLIESMSVSPWEQIRINFFVDDKDQPDKEPVRFHWHPDWRNKGTWVGSGLFFNVREQ